MNKTIKLAVAGLIVALATTVGMAAPADAKRRLSLLRRSVLLLTSVTTTPRRLWARRDVTSGRSSQRHSGTPSRAP